MLDKKITEIRPVQEWEKILRGNIGPGDALALYDDIPQKPEEAFAAGFNRAYLICTSEKPVVRLPGELPPDPEEMNEMRAIQASGAIFHYADNEYRKGDGAEFAFGDLLCNLRHWADRYGKDWQVELANAMENYHLETSELPSSRPGDPEAEDDESDEPASAPPAP